jgi:hypothetical protein
MKDDRNKEEKLMAAAVVKMKYLMNTGSLDNGFNVIYKGVLQDLGITSDEVEKYIQSNKESLKRVCFDGK